MIFHIVWPSVPPVSMISKVLHITLWLNSVKYIIDLFSYISFSFILCEGAPENGCECGKFYQNPRFAISLSLSLSLSSLI